MPVGVGGSDSTRRDRDLQSQNSTLEVKPSEGFWRGFPHLLRADPGIYDEPNLQLGVVDRSRPALALKILVDPKPSPTPTQNRNSGCLHLNLKETDEGTSPCF